MMEEQIKLFLQICAALKASLSDGSTGYGVGKSFNDFKKAGISEDTLKWLKAHHYITWKDKNKDCWIAWKNPKFPNQTINNLSKTLRNFNGEKIWGLV